ALWGAVAHRIRYKCVANRQCSSTPTRSWPSPGRPPHRPLERWLFQTPQAPSETYGEISARAQGDRSGAGPSRSQLLRVGSLPGAAPIRTSERTAAGALTAGTGLALGNCSQRGQNCLVRYLAGGVMNCVDGTSAREAKRAISLGGRTAQPPTPELTNGKLV